MKIHLLIDNERYPLIIKREEEQLYRDAAKQIDYKLNKYRNKFPNFNTEKYWVMTALELTASLARAGPLFSPPDAAQSLPRLHPA